MFVRATRKLIITSLQGMLVLALVITAVYVSIGRILISRIDQYQVNIEEVVSAAINLPVSVSKLEGGWTYLDPKFVAVDLVIGSLEEPVISIKKVGLGLDIVASIRQMKPVIREIELNGLSLVIEKDASGRWLVQGLPRSDKPFNIDPLIDGISDIASVHLVDVSIDVLGHRVHYNISSDPDNAFELSREDDLRTLFWPLILRYKNNDRITSTPFRLTGQYKGHLREKDFHSNLYLQLPSLELSEFLPTVKFREYELTEARISGEFWIGTAKNELTLTGRPILESVKLSSQDKQIELAKMVSIEFSAKGSEDDGVMIFVKSLSGLVANEDWQLNDLGLAASFSEDKWQVVAHIPSISLAKVNQSTLAVGEELGLLTAASRARLKATNIKGSVEDLMFLGVFGGDTPELKLTANLVNFSTDVVKNTPSISLLNGFMSLSQDKGYFDLHNDRPFKIHVPDLFREPWLFDSAHTRMFYEYQPGHLKLHSGIVEARKGDLITKGKVYLNLPKNVLQHTWGLELGVRHAELLDSHRYLPKTVSEDLTKWLFKSILGGSASESGMVFHGSLARIAPKNQKVHEIYFRVHDVILDYDPQWPRFDDLNATIYIGNRKIYSDDAVATVFDSQIFNSEVTVPVSRHGLVDTILIDGQLRGPFSDGLRMLTETPLFGLTGEMAEGWQGQGMMSGHAKLNIPLGARIGQETMADLTITLTETEVYMPQYDLKVSHLAGDFSYETVKGINSKHFSANLFDRDVVGTVATIGQQTGGLIDIGLTGDVDLQDLYDWSEQTLLTQAEGIMAYQATLHIPYGVRDQEPIMVEASSTLEGVAINLPVPMRKSANEEMNLYYQQAFLEPGYLVEMKMGTQVQASIKVMDGTLRGGRVHFGEQLMGAVTFDSLRVSGLLENVNYEEWEAVSERLEGKSSVSLEDELAETLDAIDITVGSLVTYGFELEDVDTYITRKSDRWKVRLKNQMLEGSILVLDDEASPLSIDLDVLRIEEGEGEDADPLSDVDPADLLAVDVHVAKLLLGQEDYGSWSFNYRPRDSGSVLESLTAEVKGMHLRGEGWVNWNYVDGRHTSSFKGSVFVPEVSEALKQWGFASSVEGENFELQTNVTWPGSPAMVDLETISGNIEIDSGRGRFVQADANVGPLKLIGIFDFASLGKRFRFDFSDVVKSGFSFDKIEGSARFSKGVIDVVDPILITGSGSIFKVGGRVDLKKGELDNDMIVTLPVNRNLPWYAAYSAFAMGPLTGASVYLANKLFKNQINAISSAKYKITGSIENPEITFVSIFSDSVRETPIEIIEHPTGE